MNNTPLNFMNIVIASGFQKVDDRFKTKSCCQLAIILNLSSNDLAIKTDPFYSSGFFLQVLIPSRG
jgi:hypothetical protein